MKPAPTRRRLGDVVGADLSDHFVCTRIEAASSMDGSKEELSFKESKKVFFRILGFFPFAFFVSFFLFGVIVARIAMGAVFSSISGVV